MRKKRSLGEISDGFVYYVLCLHPNLPVHKVYDIYIKDLMQKGILSDYDCFAKLIQIGICAREAEPKEQQMLLRCIRRH